MRRAAPVALLLGLAVALPVHAQPAPAPSSDRPAPAADRPAPTPAPAAEPAPAPATPPAAAAPGTLVVVADADGLVAELRAGSDTRAVGLKKGENRFEYPAGVVKIVIKKADGATVHEAEVQVPSGAEARVQFASRGQLVVKAPEGGKVEVDGKALEAKDGQVAADVDPGDHSVVVTAPGKVGQKGQVGVTAGKTTTVQAKLDAFQPAGNTTLAYVGMIGGGALVVTALVIDATTRFDELGGDATRWGLFGVGAAGFVGGTILLKSTMDEQPPVQDRGFDVQVSGVGLAPTKGGAMAQVQLKF